MEKSYKEGIDQGPWFVYTDGTEIFVMSNDFTHDVTLDLRGDFGSYDVKRRYAHFICEALNQRAQEIKET